MTEHLCRKCSNVLTSNEINLYRKLVLRSADTFLCIDCLAEELSTTRDKLENLIAYYYETGICSLFIK